MLIEHIEKNHSSVFARNIATRSMIFLQARLVVIGQSFYVNGMSLFKNHHKKCQRKLDVGLISRASKGFPGANFLLKVTINIINI